MHHHVQIHTTAYLPRYLLDTTECQLLSVEEEQFHIHTGVTNVMFRLWQQSTNSSHLGNNLDLHDETSLMLAQTLLKQYRVHVTFESSNSNLLIVVVTLYQTV